MKKGKVVAENVMTELRKLREGKAKSQAKGVKRKGVAGFGVAIVKAMEAVNTTVRDAVLAFAKQDTPTQLLAINEVETARDNKVAECVGERKEKQVRSVRSNFARTLTIMRAIQKGVNKDKIVSAPSLAIMYAFASRKGTARGASNKTLTNEQAIALDKQATRLIGKAPGKHPKVGERERFDDSVGRMERHIVACLHSLAKHSTVSYLPVNQWLAQATHSSKKNGRLRKAA